MTNRVHNLEDLRAFVDVRGAALILQDHWEPWRVKQQLGKVRHVTETNANGYWLADAMIGHYPTFFEWLEPSRYRFDADGLGFTIHFPLGSMLAHWRLHLD